MKDFDLEIYLDEHAWLKVSHMGGNLIARHRCSLEEKQEIANILIKIGNRIKSENKDKNELS